MRNESRSHGAGRPWTSSTGRLIQPILLPDDSTCLAARRRRGLSVQRASTRPRRMTPLPALTRSPPMSLLTRAAASVGLLFLLALAVLAGAPPKADKPMKACLVHYTGKVQGV